MERMLCLLIGWIADLFLGDPPRLPHPIVGFGKLIALCERRWNHGAGRRLKGIFCALLLVSGTFCVTALLLEGLHWIWTPFSWCLQTILIFYCLAGTTLRREVCDVFRAVDRSLEEGRKQVSRIVGRDTSQLTAQEVRTAALETLAENLSDGVVAPLFWLALLGVPGMMAYKMVNTLDSMIGYRTERYRQFGCTAARLDDVANYLPARLTALLMIVVSGRLSLLAFVWRYGNQHASPNSGYPESALAGILGCRFGGPHHYFGEEVWKPYIGHTDRPLNSSDMRTAIGINLRTEVLMLLLTLFCG